MTERHLRVTPFTRTEGPAAVLSGATILLGHAVAINLHGLEFVIAASDYERLLDAASYIMDCKPVITEHVYSVALCKREMLRTPDRPNGV